MPTKVIKKKMIITKFKHEFAQAMIFNASQAIFVKKDKMIWWLKQLRPSPLEIDNREDLQVRTKTKKFMINLNHLCWKKLPTWS